jgi:hypothetical protein
MPEKTETTLKSYQAADLSTYVPPPTKQATESSVTSIVKKKVIEISAPGPTSLVVYQPAAPSEVLKSYSSDIIPGEVFPSGLQLPSDVFPTQGFHLQPDVNESYHPGLDLAGPAGTPIYAPEDLQITQAGSGAWGLDVIGATPDQNAFIFGHLEQVNPALQVGAKIPAGTLLGFEGSTFTPPGFSSGPHLHLQENNPSGTPIVPSAQDVLATFLQGGSIGGAGAPAPSLVLGSKEGVTTELKLPSGPSSIPGSNPAAIASASAPSSTTPADTNTASSTSSTEGPGPYGKEAASSLPATDQTTPVDFSPSTTATPSGTVLLNTPLGAVTTPVNVKSIAVNWGVMILGSILIMIGVVLLITSPAIGVHETAYKAGGKIGTHLKEHPEDVGKIAADLAEVAAMG